MNQYVFEPVKPVVETRFGKLRGVTYGDVNIFMGVRYAVAKRFQMPEEQQPWEGVKNAYQAGPVSKLTNPHMPFDYYRGLHLLHKESEDCQNLNIWAPKTENGVKKPVFVWMHGGGFFAGNAVEEYSFDGFNVAHYGDVVFVSINHRLNILGHFNLSEYGPEFKNSINAGIADLVAALKWIHENIAEFGGDPENVTIVGHSGGGGKVLSMYQIEEAAPYFQRGICMSGAVQNTSDHKEADSKRLAKGVMDELGITKENIEKINEVSFEEIVAAYKKVARPMAEEGCDVGFGPLKDDYFHGFPVNDGYLPCSAKKPLMFSTTLGEFPMVHLSEEEKAAMTDEDKMNFMRDRFGADTDKLVALFKEAYPAHDVFDLVYLDYRFREPAYRSALLKAKENSDNTYMALCAYNAPEDGWIPLWHGGDVCYVLMNEDKVFVLNEAIYGQKLSQIFSSSFLNFVKTGDPNCNYLPKWEPFTTEHHNTMVIDRECAQKESYDEELLALYMKACPQFKRVPRI